MAILLTGWLSFWLGFCVGIVWFELRQRRRERRGWRNEHLFR